MSAGFIRAFFTGILISTLAAGMVWVRSVAADAESAPKYVTVMDPIIVTARGRDRPASATPGGTGSISAAEIFSRMPYSLSQTAPLVPGVYQSADSFWGADINIRGLGRNRIVVLIDGCRVNTTTDINAQLGLLDPKDVERIEILKGPVSALYGSGALGGVVNIITKKGEFSDISEWHGTISSGFTKNPAGLNVYGNTFQSADKNWIYASGAHRDVDSYTDGNGHEVHNSQFDDLSGKLAIARKWAAESQSEFQIQRYQAHEVGIPGTGIAPLPLQSDVTYPEISRTLVNFKHNASINGSVFKSSNVNAFYQRIDRQVQIDQFSSGPIQKIQTQALHQTLGVTWQNQLAAGDHNLMLGLDIWHWAYDGLRTKRFDSGNIIKEKPLTDSSQLSAGIFVEDDWQLTDRMTLNAGLRIDHISEKSDALYQSVVPPGNPVRPAESHQDVSWNAHAGLTWRLAEEWSFTLIAASSYRTPDLLDRFKYIYFSPGNELYGNPDLDPERSLFFESGLHYLRAGVRLVGNIFYNRIRDLIIDPGPIPGVRRMKNTDAADIYGFEADVRLQVDNDWSFFANAAYARGRNITAEEDLAFIPPLNGLAGIRYDKPRSLWATIEVEWAVKQKHVPPAGETTGGWAILSAATGYRFDIGRTWHELVFRVGNLFDADIRNHLSTSRGIELKEPGMNFSVAWMMEF